MSRLTFVILLCLFTGQFGWGQTQITALPNGMIYRGNTFSLDQWQWQISSTQYTGQAVFIQVAVFDHQNLLVYRISGHPFPLTGQSLYSGNTLNQAETQFIAPAYQRSLERLHCLPKGKYRIESTLFLVAAPDNQPIARHRQSWHQRQACSLPISPMAPANNLSVCETYPLFQWSPINPSPELIYEFSLYEHTAGNERPTATLSQPLVQISLTTPAYQLQPGDLPLQKGRKYSWRILARESGNIVGQSPVQHFLYGCSADKEADVSDLPARLVYLKAGKNGHIPNYTVREPVLNFSFVQRIPQDKYQLEIKDEQGNTLSLQTIPTQTGHNYLSLPFSDLGLPRLENGRQLSVHLLPALGKGGSFSIRMQNP